MSDPIDPAPNHSHPRQRFNVGATVAAFRAARPDLADDVRVRADGLLIVTPKGFSELLSWCVDAGLMTSGQARQARGDAEAQARGGR